MWNDGRLDRFYVAFFVVVVVVDRHRKPAGDLSGGLLIRTFYILDCRIETRIKRILITHKKHPQIFMNLNEAQIQF